MNKNTEKLFFRSVDSLLDRYNPDHPEFKLHVWKRYQSLAAAQRFVSEMLEERYTKKHSEDKLATVSPCFEARHATIMSKKEVKEIMDSIERKENDNKHE